MLRPFVLALLIAALIPARAGAAPDSAPPPQRLHLHEIARRLHHPAALMPLADFRASLHGGARYSRMRTPDDRVITLQTGWIESKPAEKGSKFYGELSRRLSEKPWTLIPNITIQQLEKAHPWSAPSEGNDWYAHMRAEIINTFAGWADEHGEVDLDRVRRDLGDGSARALIDTVTARTISRDVRIPSQRLLAYLSPEARRLAMQPLRDKIVPDGMRVLSWMSRRYAVERAQLSEHELYGLQHIVGNTSALLRETGIAPDKMALWGKPYSLETVVAHDLSERGVLVNADEFRRDKPRFVAQLRQRLKGLDPATTKPRQLLLLDDGGELIEAVAELVKTEFPGHAHLFSAAEQTTKGIRLVRKLADRGALPFPVVDIASSWVKRKWGSPMFGYAIAREAQRVVDQYAGLAKWRPGTLVLFGYGAIGRAVAAGAQRLERRRVIVLDPDPAAQRQVIADGFEVASSKEAALAEAELLISTVGGPMLGDEDLPKLPKQAIVVNGASAREFNLTESDRTLNQRPMHHPLDDDHQSASFHDFTASLDLDHVIYNIFDSRRPPAPGQRIGYAPSFQTFAHPKAQALNARIPDQIVVAAKGGGVANFPQSLSDSYGGSAVPGRYIQLDIGLLYLGLLQARGEQGPGIVALDHARQRELVSFVERDLRRQGQSLKQPTW